MLSSSEGAIGVFDSGVGGLTVMHSIMSRLPHESIIYLGDTARVPYGTKSPQTVIRYAERCSEILVKRGIKLLVIACNTASAHAIPVLQERYTIPIIGVVEPGACAAAKITRGNRIGIIATEGTINSEVYPKAIKALIPDVDVYSQACPMFVPLAEEGWTHGLVPTEIAKKYLDGFSSHAIDTLVLGCTHYPLLTETIQAVLGDSIHLVDSAQETACVVDETLTAMNQLASTQELPIHEYLVSDDPEKFSAVGAHFLGRAVEPVEWVDV